MTAAVLPTLRCRAALRGSVHRTDELDESTWRANTLRRHLDSDMIDRVVRKYAQRIGLIEGFSAHSMRATFITRALDNGASLEEVQKAAGHADASTTKLYDRRGYNPEKSASFFATY
jgi:site-specific recombinase XerD